MADEQTTTTEAPLTNTMEARTADGTLKDQGTQTTNTTDTTTTTQSTEGTTLLTEPDKKPEGKAEKKPEDKVGAPAEYEPFKAPEGYEFDDKGQAEATAIFKDLGLSQDQAQKLMDVYATKSIEAGKDAHERALTAVKEMRDGWQKETREDPEIGKILPAVKVTIGRALDSLGDKALTDNFKAAMDLTGSGDHPAFIKVFYKLAQAVVEGGHVAGTGPSALGQTANGKTTRPTAAQAMYPNLPSSNS